MGKDEFFPKSLIDEISTKKRKSTSYDSGPMTPMFDVKEEEFPNLNESERESERSKLCLLQENQKASLVANIKLRNRQKWLILLRKLYIVKQVVNIFWSLIEDRKQRRNIIYIYVYNIYIYINILYIIYIYIFR